MRACQHCGEAHSDDTRRCPRTGAGMSEDGPIGTLIDRYKVEKLIGTGGFGAVYQAVHHRTNQPVALKVLKKEKAEDSAAVDRFMREAKAVTGLPSEHIVKVLDADISSDGIPFIAMELLDGTDLQQLDKEKGPLHPERLIGIMIQTLDALAAAHEKGIVHRDMKPGNIFITRRKNPSGIERDVVKLLDFGISKIHMQNEKVLTLAGTTLGTPGYMAYEQFVDARSVDARADLYSVAAMLYELLARRLPYQANSYGELVMKIENETPPPLKSLVPMLPDSLCLIVDKGLKKNRNERFASAREFQDALTMVGPLRDVQLRTAIAMSALPPADSSDPSDLQETRARAPTTEPAPRNEPWQMAQTVVAATAVRVPDSTVLMPPPDFKETKDSQRDVQATAELPGPRPSRPISMESRNRALGLGSYRSRWPLALLGGGVLLVAGAIVLYLALR